MSSDSKQIDSVVLEEEIDPTYEPSDDEVIEYAKWLGFNLPEDQDLLYIAREGLKAPLPEEWKPCKTTDTEEIYYFNFQTGESTWDHPCDDYYKKQYEEAKYKKITKKKEKEDARKQREKAAVKELIQSSSSSRNLSTSSGNQAGIHSGLNNRHASQGTEQLPDRRKESRGISIVTSNREEGRPLGFSSPGHNVTRNGNVSTGPPLGSLKPLPGIGQSPLDRKPLPALSSSQNSSSIQQMEGFRPTSRASIRDDDEAEQLGRHQSHNNASAAGDWTADDREQIQTRQQLKQASSQTKEFAEKERIYESKLAERDATIEDLRKRLVVSKGDSSDLQEKFDRLKAQLEDRQHELDSRSRRLMVVESEYREEKLELQRRQEEELSNQSELNSKRMTRLVNQHAVEMERLHSQHQTALREAIEKTRKEAIETASLQYEHRLEDTIQSNRNLQRRLQNLEAQLDKRAKKQYQMRPLTKARLLCNYSILADESTKSLQSTKTRETQSELLEKKEKLQSQLDSLKELLAETQTELKHQKSDFAKEFQAQEKATKQLVEENEKLRADLEIALHDADALRSQGDGSPSMQYELDQLYQQHMKRVQALGVLEADLKHLDETGELKSILSNIRKADKSFKQHTKDHTCANSDNYVLRKVASTRQTKSLTSLYLANSVDSSSGSKDAKLFSPLTVVPHMRRLQVEMQTGLSIRPCMNSSVRQLDVSMDDSIQKVDNNTNNQEIAAATIVKLFQTKLDECFSSVGVDRKNVTTMTALEPKLLDAIRENISKSIEQYLKTSGEHQRTAITHMFTSNFTQLEERLMHTIKRLSDNRDDNSTELNQRLAEILQVSKLTDTKVSLIQDIKNVLDAPNKDENSANSQSQISSLLTANESVQQQCNSLLSQLNTVNQSLATAITTNEREVDKVRSLEAEVAALREERVILQQQLKSAQQRLDEIANASPQSKSNRTGDMVSTLRRAEPCHAQNTCNTNEELKLQHGLDESHNESYETAPNAPMDKSHTHHSSEEDASAQMRSNVDGGVGFEDERSQIFELLIYNVKNQFEMRVHLDDCGLSEMCDAASKLKAKLAEHRKQLLHDRELWKADARTMILSRSRRYTVSNQIGQCIYSQQQGASVSSAMVSPTVSSNASVSTLLTPSPPKRRSRYRYLSAESSHERLSRQNLLLAAKEILDGQAAALNRRIRQYRAASRLVDQVSGIIQTHIKRVTRCIQEVNDSSKHTSSRVNQLQKLHIWDDIVTKQLKQLQTECDTTLTIVWKPWSHRLKALHSADKTLRKPLPEDLLQGGRSPRTSHNVTEMLPYDADDDHIGKIDTSLSFQVSISDSEVSRHTGGAAQVNHATKVQRTLRSSDRDCHIPEEYLENVSGTVSDSAIWGTTENRRKSKATHRSKTRRTSAERSDRTKHRVLQRPTDRTYRTSTKAWLSYEPIQMPVAGMLDLDTVSLNRKYKMHDKSIPDNANVIQSRKYRPNPDAHETYNKTSANASASKIDLNQIDTLLKATQAHTTWLAQFRRTLGTSRSIAVSHPSRME